MTSFKNFRRPLRPKLVPPHDGSTTSVDGPRNLTIQEHETASVRTDRAKCAVQNICSHITDKATKPHSVFSQAVFRS